MCKEFDQLIELIEKQVEQCAQKISKLDRLVEQGYQRLDVQKKRVMDSIKIFARNIFYKTIATFKAAYDNYRDDHEYFRRCTHAPGLWVETEKSITVYLDPAPHLPPKIRHCIAVFLDDLQKEPLVLPDGSGRKNILELLPVEGIKLAIA